MSNNKDWQLWNEEGPVKPGHKTGHPCSYSICINDYDSDDHECIAMTFGNSPEEAFERAKTIVEAVTGKRITTGI